MSFASGTLLLLCLKYTTAVVGYIHIYRYICAYICLHKYVLIHMYISCLLNSSALAYVLQTVVYIHICMYLYYKLYTWRMSNLLPLVINMISISCKEMILIS